jgi:hypothetical protein
LSESKPGTIAMRAHTSAVAIVSDDSPGPSAPSKSATRAGRGTSRMSTVADGVSAITV